MPTPNLSLPTVPNGQTNLSAAFNQAMQILDALTPLAVQDKDLADPPTTVSGDVGKRWIVAASPTAGWAGQAGKIALCVAANVWSFINPPPYIIAYIIDEEAEYRNIGGTWTPVVEEP